MRLTDHPMAAFLTTAWLSIPSETFTALRSTAARPTMVAFTSSRPEHAESWLENRARSSYSCPGHPRARWNSNRNNKGKSSLQEIELAAFSAHEQSSRRSKEDRKEICATKSRRPARAERKHRRENMKLSVEAKVAAAVAAGFIALTVGAIAQQRSEGQTGGPNNYRPLNNPGVNTHI